MAQMFRLSRAVGLAGALALAGAAQAGVVAGAVTGGSSMMTYADGPIFMIASPGTVGADSKEDFVVRGWNEKQNVMLMAPLSVDYVVATGLPGVLGPGMRVDSHGVHLDPPNGKLPQRNFEGFVTFSRPIIALITSTGLLVASDVPLGDPGTTYLSFAHRGLEGSDLFSISMDQKTLYFDFTARIPGDNVRVLTYVPEPATWAMLVAGFGLVGFAARRHRREARRIAA